MGAAPLPKPLSVHEIIRPPADERAAQLIEDEIGYIVADVTTARQPVQLDVANSQAEAREICWQHARQLPGRRFAWYRAGSVIEAVRTDAPALEEHTT